VIAVNVDFWNWDQLSMSFENFVHLLSKIRSEFYRFFASAPKVMMPNEAI
jgi:hypothetical protein